MKPSALRFDIPRFAHRSPLTRLSREDRQRIVAQQAEAVRQLRDGVDAPPVNAR